MYKNYITGQTALTLNLDFTITANHLANTISWFVDSIPEDVLLGKTAKTGRPAYHPAMMLLANQQKISDQAAMPMN